MTKREDKLYPTFLVMEIYGVCEGEEHVVLYIANARQFVNRGFAVTCRKTRKAVAAQLSSAFHFYCSTCNVKR
jgi:hypothetical protein